MGFGVHSVGHLGSSGVGSGMALVMIDYLFKYWSNHIIVISYTCIMFL